jgi:hypothetical protein
MATGSQEPVEVIRNFTEGWLTAAEDLVKQITSLTQLGVALADHQTEELCRWGDDGGFCP